MPFPIYLGWGLLVPVVLSLLFACLSEHAMSTLGYKQKNTVLKRILNYLPAFLLFFFWGMVNIPLPLFYILAYGGKLSRLLRNSRYRSKELFLINLTHLTTMALHMIPVSYTHLDVYKRQELSGYRLRALLSSIMAKRSSRVHRP